MTKNKLFVTLFVISLLFTSVFHTQPVHADVLGTGKYFVDVRNHITATQAVDGINPVVGAVYQVKQLQTIDETGLATDTNVVVGTFTLEAGKVNGFKTDVAGRYEFTQITRAPGYLLNATPFVVEFPRMTDGVIDTDQTVVVYPKVFPVNGSAQLTKLDGTTKLAGAVFQLWQLSSPITADPPVTYPIQWGGDFTTGTDGIVSATDLPEGTYEWREITPPAGYTKITTPVPFTITVGSDPKVQPAQVTSEMQNYPVPVIIKDVEGTDSYATNIGVDFDFHLTVPIPADIAKYTSFYVTDTLHSSLTYVGWASDVTATHNWVDPTLTVSYVIQDLVDALAAGKTEVVITITAKINTTAIQDTGIPNTATLHYNNGQGGSGDVPSNEVIVTPTEGSITINKWDSSGKDGGVKVDGAVFQLFTDAAATVPAKSVIDGTDLVGTSTNGVVSFTRLPYGTYYLKEVKAPDGYRISTQITTVVVGAGTGEQVAWVYDIKNYLITEQLPTTGTSGAVIFLAAGAALVAGAFLVNRKKNTKEE